MDVLGFTEARARLDVVMKGVVADHNPVVIVRPAGGAVVLVSLADWRAREETARLLSSSTNAKRLAGAVAQLNAAPDS
jgi:antitoxin YefM